MKNIKHYGHEMAREVDYLATKEAGRAMGWVSLAVGLTELAFPCQLERTMGIGNGQNTGILRVLGVREVMHGFDLLAHADPTPGLWARVAGDVLDGVMLGLAATKTRRPGGLATIVAVVAPVVLADMVLAPKLTEQKAARRRFGFFR